MAPPWVPRACVRRGCKVMLIREEHKMQTVLQHGDNPEAVLIIEDFEIIRLQVPAGMSFDAVVYCHMEAKRIQWANAVHRYEDEGMESRAPGSAGSVG